MAKQRKTLREQIKDLRGMLREMHADHESLLAALKIANGRSESQRLFRVDAQQKGIREQDAAGGEE